MAEINWEAMLQGLAEDRRKRDEEIENERARREAEVVDERRLREEEHVAREAEMARRLEEERRSRGEEREAMRNQMDQLAKMVERSVVAAGAKSPAELGIKLVALRDSDDIEAYLVTFERIMAAHKIERSRWRHYLAPQLSGRAQLAFVALPITDSANYDAIKAAILMRYDLNEEAYRNCFRTAVPKVGETHREFSVRLMDLLSKWLREYKTVDDIQQEFGMEQLLNCLTPEKRLWLLERKPKGCVKAGEMLDTYEQARRKEGGPVKQRQGVKESETLQESEKVPRDTPVLRRPEQRSSGRGPRCFSCHQLGHISSKCPSRGSYYGGRFGNCRKFKKTDGDTLVPVRSGKVEGTDVSDIVLDTGAGRTLVRSCLVPRKRLLGRNVMVECVHGDRVSYPLARVEVIVDEKHYWLEAAAVKKLPMSVLLGRDVPELVKIGPTVEGPKKSWVMAATTRAQAKKRMEEDARTVQKEKQSGAKATPVMEQVDSDVAMDSLKNSLDNAAVLHRAEGVKAPEKPEQLDGEAEKLFNVEKIQRLQREDPTLQPLWKAAKGERTKVNVWFYEENGMLYRHWQPLSDGEGLAIEQLVLPVAVRRTVMTVAHEIPLAGHMGKKRTVQRVLQRFYWPSVYRDVAEWCKCCAICQKCSKGRKGYAPLMPLPIIEEPFGRIAMDIVGPLPRSRSGNKYVLVVCDYATRYPEAVALKSIDAEHVAEELIPLFARVGVPREILTDQGSNFTSRLLEELYRLLHVRPIRTSPYHPQTDGLVERFNGTLKAMLRKVATAEGQDWDKWLPYVLFAYREVPQASTGFSPFELVYGRQVRGPLDILKETWEAPSQGSDESIVSYVLSVQERLAKSDGIGEEEPGAGSSRAEAVVRPTCKRTSVQRWRPGAGITTDKVTPVTYEVNMHDKRKKKRIFHVNMLKEWNMPTTVCLWTEEVNEEGEEEIPLWERNKENGEMKVGKMVGTEQLRQLHDLHKDFADVIRNTPGRTNLAVHSIETNGPPTRLPPYRLPYCYRDSVKEELEEMLKHGVIERSNSPWASPMVLVKKKDGSLRVCVDFRRLNGVTRQDAYPMPRIDELIDRLGRAKVITTLDLSKGYWQVPVAAEDRAKTAFSSPYGLFQFTVMPFGLQGAPATFQRMMDELLRGTEGYSAAYLDDIVIYSDNWKDHMKHLKEVFRRLRKAALTVKFDKCQFGMDQCIYLGHMVGNGTVRPENSKLEALKEFPIPRTKTAVRGFLGLAGYYRRFIPNFAETAAPLTDLTRKTATKEVQWNSECGRAFEKLKSLLCGEPVLKCPDFEKPFVLQTDASDRGVGAVLSQLYEGEDHPVAYFSRKLLPREEKYSVVEKECLAIKLAVQIFRVYLLGRSFTIQTDHRSLEWLDRLKDANNRLMRWSLALQPFQFSVQYRTGKANANADALSRAFSDGATGVSLEKGGGVSWSKAKHDENEECDPMNRCQGAECKEGRLMKGGPTLKG
ncbi:hypothetical protein EMCRGX_G002255 [Ephydatia muelleri]